jgi:hypothetical protein
MEINRLTWRAHACEIGAGNKSFLAYMPKIERFWCADDLTYDVELDLDSGDHNDDATTEGTELKGSKRTVSSRSSHSGRAGRSNRSNSVISSIEVAVINLKESPKLTRNSTTGIFSNVIIFNI